MDLEAYLILDRFDERFSLLSHDTRLKERHLHLSSGDPRAQLHFHTDHPERNVAAIAESQKYVESRQTVPRKFRTRLASDIKMQAAVRLSHTEKQLETVRKKMHKEQIHLAHQWKVLEQDEEQLRNNFIHFDKALCEFTFYEMFVKENDRKRTRAHHLIDEERRIIAERQQKLDDLENLRKEIEKTIVKMEESIEKHKTYKIFLQTLVNIAPEFKTILDVVNRYNCLAHAKESMLQQQNSNLCVFESAKVETMKLIEEKNFVIMGLNNQIANLQARYENANIKALESEELVTEIKNNAVKQLSEIDTVKTSIWNVYVHMTLSKKHPIKIKRDNVEEQMMYINRTLTELSKVNKLINKKRPAKMK